MAAVQARGRGSSQSPLRHKSHVLWVDSTAHRSSMVDAPRCEGRRTNEERIRAQMSDTLNEGMLVQRMNLNRNAKRSDNMPSRLMILIEHMDGTDYLVGVADRGETPEYLTTLLAVVSRGANMMIRALDILRTIGYVDMRPVAVLGREIVFGLDRVTLELEIFEHSDGNVDCGISVAGVNAGNVEEVGNTLEENGINVV